MAARYTGLLLQYEGTPLSDVYGSRTELEVSAVGIIAGRRGNSSLNGLEDLVREGAALVANESEFAKYSLRFHLSVVESAGSSTSTVLAKILFHIIEAHNSIFIEQHPRGYEVTANRSAQRAYVKLVKLLREEDVEGAQRHWRRHLEAVEKFMVGDGDTTLVEVLN
nr:FCD domain-containing protein [Williamsia sp. DF01-3]